MTKDEWLARCAARLEQQGGMTPSLANTTAIECLNNCAADLGSVANAIEGFTPEEAADTELAYRESDAA